MVAVMLLNPCYRRGNGWRSGWIRPESTNYPMRIWRIWVSRTHRKSLSMAMEDGPWMRISVRNISMMSLLHRFGVGVITCYSTGKGRLNGSMTRRARHSCIRIILIHCMAIILWPMPLRRMIWLPWLKRVARLIGSRLTMIIWCMSKN